MPVSYVEDVTAAWLEASGHLVFRNVWFQQDRERRSWSDLDVLAVKGTDVAMYSCKSFLGNGKADVIADEQRAKFDEAEEVLKSEERYSGEPSFK